MSSDETELMARVRDGDRDAFEAVVDRYWSHILVYARSMTRDGDAAMDITQEAFLRLWQRREQWVQTGSVRIWLLRTVRNLTISEQRKWKVRNLWATRASAEGVTLPRTPLQDAETRELRQAINEAVEKLSPRRREAFTLFHLQGLSYREIAEIMEVREQTVANYLQAALADLRESLASFFPALGNRRGRQPPANSSETE
jgi:RNA polymerase sigma-70 factor, ECF subfamily